MQLSQVYEIFYSFSMHIIKLSAIDSTNSYLKQLISNQFVENYTVVLTKNQTNGKGQMGSRWESESGKNLTMSVLVKDSLLLIEEIFSLNCLISIAVLEVLKNKASLDLSVKWPNDIMSGNYKIGGILIENNIKSDGEIQSIVGIGINVNQINFTDLPKASSLKNITGKEFDLLNLVVEIVERIKFHTAKLRNGNTAEIWNLYHKHLFKLGMPMPFELPSGERFMGIIQKVNKEGRLQLLLDDDRVLTFGVKEVVMLY